MPVQLQDIATSIVLLFIVLDPIGVSPYVASIVSRSPEEGRLSIIRLAIASAGVILLAFTLVGRFILGLLGVDRGEFMIAAGALLLIYATADLFEVKIGYSESSEEVAIFPLATPLLAGPGAIATSMYIVETYGLVAALVAILANLALSYPILAGSSKLVAVLGRHGSLLIGKFTAFLMVGFAVSIIFEGLEYRGFLP
ncbi:MAG: MarC family protein [Aeropyrum sp.]|nr:MarC family protein [Aeropyrum sp.]